MQISNFLPITTQLVFPGWNIRPAIRFEIKELEPEQEQAAYRALALAIVTQAIEDARDPDPLMRLDALSWLRDSAPVIFDLMDVEFCRDAWRLWVESGCPKRTGKKRRLYRVDKNKSISE